MSIHWSDLSPDPGHPHCLCSLCVRPIPEDEVPIRVFKRIILEARFHHQCFSQARPELEKQSQADEGVLDSSALAETIVNRFAQEALDLPVTLSLNRLASIIVETLEGRQAEPEEPEPDDELDLGQCCSCRTTENVRNIIAIPKRAPVPGTGWGCVQCDLPADGAIAVLCDACLESEAKILDVCYRYPQEGIRVELEALVEPFDHDLSKHPESFQSFPGK